MIEFNKIFCDLHPNELVSNYCAHQQCNVALCATCICSHTESHIQRRTAPDYENIRTTYSKMQDCLRTRISALQHQKSRINLVIENIHAKRKGIAELIMQARHQTLDFVNKFYDAKEKEVLRKIEADEKKLGLHNQNRMQTLMNMLSRDVNSLFAAASDLNSQNFLQNFNRIRTQVLSNSLITKNEISEELDKNESYDVNLSINPIYINDIKNGLEKSINLIYDEKKNAGRMMERNENIKSNSRVVVPKQTSNQSSGVHVVKRASQSLPKPAIQASHPTRYTSAVMEQVPYFVKQSAPQPKAQPHHQSFTINSPYITNNSHPVNLTRPNHQSRIEVRVNSSEKNIKENQKHPLSQSYMEPSLSSSNNLWSTPQLDNTKKIRKSGLTILRTLENDRN